MPDKRKSSVLEFAIIFLIVYVGTQFVFERMFPERYNRETESVVQLSMTDNTVKDGHHPIVTVRNDTAQPIVLQDDCPMPPFDVYKVRDPGESTEEFVELEADSTATECPGEIEIQSGDSYTYELAPWKYSLFDDFATYELRLPYEAQDGAQTATARFDVHEAGTITQIFRTFITEPLLNLLIFIASVMPGYNLGLAIIILTLIVKFILFIPTQHALEGQRKLQEIQPKIEELRKKYKSDPQKLNEETLKLWRKEKINPMQACLPTLLQFPFLIGLFFVIRDGSVLELSQHLVYDFYKDIPWSFNTSFLGFDLLKPSLFIFPPLLFVLQFSQMKLSFAIAKKKKDKKADVIDVPAKGKKAKKKKEAKEEPSAQELQQRMMVWGLPIMIAVFAAQFPVAVSLYWAISTVFAIGQQLYVNRKHL